MDMPIVFIAGRPDAPVIVRAMKARAVDVLVEPVNSEQLLSAVDAAIELSRAALLRDASLAATPNLLRVGHASRTRGDGAGGVGTAQQADSLRARHQRDYGEGASRSGHAKDEGGIAAAPGQDGGAP